MTIPRNASFLPAIFLSAALYGCDNGGPIKTILASEEEWTTEQAGADAHNVRLGEKYKALIGNSLDGKGQVFFAHGVGIIYTEPHTVTPSKPLPQHVCTDTHWWSDRCVVSKEYPTAYAGRITNHGQKIYTIAHSGLVCQGALPALTSMIYNTKIKGCLPFGPNAVSKDAYALLAEKMKTREVTTREVLQWRRDLP